jgi:hypothetical protein
MTPTNSEPKRRNCIATTQQLAIECDKTTQKKQEHLPIMSTTRGPFFAKKVKNKASGGPNATSVQPRNNAQVMRDGLVLFPRNQQPMNKKKLYCVHICPTSCTSGSLSKDEMGFFFCKSQNQLSKQCVCPLSKVIVDPPINQNKTYKQTNCE